MIDQQQQRDLTEERAVQADADRENREEQAHADLVAETVRHLRTLSHNAHADAAVTVNRLLGEVNLRLAPNVHRYALLAQQQHLALLAATTAAAIEEAGSYDLPGVARGVATAYRVTHDDPTGGRRARVTLDLVVERIAAAIEEVAQHAADAATQQAIVEHEQHLAAVDAGRDS